ncbi:MAG: tetratricopeptide repeat protein [Planctomycetes bacterium]|nr:tetratricopeptide repeat protein [Planctomycetota bacterium]MBI3845088.1 tetratricopeptide repeat protein [Planctomycetota bacterium]
MFARITALTSVLAVALLAAPARAQDSDDTIRQKDGKTTVGKIQSEDYGGVAIEVKKAVLTISWKSIQAVQYGASPEFTRAMETLASGNLDDSKSQLEELKKDPKLRPPLRQQVLYHLASTNQRLGKFDDAIAGYNELLKAFPKSRYLRSAGENLVTCYLDKKDADGAGKALETFLADAKTAGVEANVQSELGLLKGRVLEAQQKIPEAKAQYEAVAKAAGIAPAAVLESELGVARCLHLSGDAASIAKAEEQYRKLVKEDAPNSVLAGAWNGIGDITKVAAVNAKSVDKMLDALFAYLRGVVQYAPLRGEPTTEYERALAGAAECFKFVSDLETNKEKKKLYLDRSNERLAQLKKEFPSSPFLKGR